MGNVHRLARPSRLLSGATAVSLSILFITVYSLTGWLASLRTEVGTWAFAWEGNLPFVPWLVVPYMSLDLFFVAAPFLCTDRPELRTLGRRMTIAILGAGATFLLMPLRFAFPRPEPAGWTAAMFEALYGFDRPFNLFPSLHLAILVILCGTYHRHTRGVARWLTHTWFGLIGLSTVLTYQHHVVDVAGGLALGFICCYLIPEYRATHPATTNARIGTCYLAASVVLGTGAISLRPAGLALLWPAVTLAIVAGAYFGFYANVARKEGGRLPLTSKVVLAPWLAGQHASLVYYRRQADAWNVVTPCVWIGRRLREREATAAVRQGVKAVLDLTGEFSEAPAFRALAYLSVPLLDLTAPTPRQLRTTIDFIHAHRDKGAVYVHCKIGYSRSAVVVGAWLIEAGLVATPGEAVAMLRAVRPSLVVRPEAFAALQGFHNRDSGLTTPARSLVEVRA
jgi:membrane-associated phospholipid phosphatase